MRTVVLKSKAIRFVEKGSPWIFEGSIAKESGSGDLAEITGPNGRHLGYGTYAEFSDLRIRMFDGNLREPNAFAIFVDRMVSRRRTLGLPNDLTTGYRLVNAEGDGCGGLVVDVFDGLAVMQLSSLPLFNRSQELAETIIETAGVRSVLQVPAAKAVEQREDLPSIAPRWFGPSIDVVSFLENGVRYEVPTHSLQKTGHYCDMRVHRDFVRTISAGKRVLDLYSYTGGFALNAAPVAAEVVAVDSSSEAIARLNRNASLNGVSIEAHSEKVEKAMDRFHSEGRKFDLIVLDPPKLAPNKSVFSKAMKKKGALVKAAVRLLEPGGVLCIGSCSAAIDIPAVERLLATNAPNSRVIWKGGASPCHPVTPAVPETCYLSFVAAVRS